MLSLFLFVLLGSPAEVDIERQFRAHVRFLSDDLLEGRESAERGQKLAARYLSTRLMEYGLRPAYPNEAEPYYQQFQLNRGYDEDGSITLYARGNGRRQWFAHGEEFLAQISGNGAINEKAPMVFVGYGLETPDYNDYGDLDVSGRWLIMLQGQPAGNGEDSPFSKPLAAANALHKLRLAKSKNPLGVIFLTGDFEKQEEASPFTQSGGDETTFPTLFIPEKMWKGLIGKDLTRFKQAKAEIDTTHQPKPFYLKRRQLEISATPPSQNGLADNVIGIIDGTDPKLKNEYIVVSAHFDHLGIVDGKVYNGADDNATGSAALILAANRLRHMKLKRSIMFLWDSGEEKGLLGSAHFVKHPPIPLEQIVANVNIDMIGRNGANTIGVIPSKGDGVSTMNALVTKINNKKRHRMNLRRDMDQFHTRSDHYNFYLAGIPAIFFFSDTHEDYHQPEDDWDKVDYDKLTRFYRMFEDFLVAQANQKQAPRFLAKSTHNGVEKAPGSKHTSKDHHHDHGHSGDDEKKPALVHH